MDLARLESVSIPKICIDSANLNFDKSFGVLSGSDTPIPVLQPIASYRAYDKTNDDTDRDVLKDLTGNGHDIQLYNFAFAESSGYGKYNCYMTATYAGIRFQGTVNQYSAHVTKLISIDNRNYINLYNISSNFKISITGVNENSSVRLGGPGYNTYEFNTDGIYDIDITKFGASINSVSFGVLGDVLDVDITIKLIPDYQGALVSDGVDDYGLCENFPILTKEKGYTVCAIRKWIDETDGSLKIALSSNFCFFERIESNNDYRTYSYGKSTTITNGYPSIFTYQKTNSYNGELINSGDKNTPSTDLKIFIYTTDNTAIALYALEIYDRDLTDEEIATVKARMIAEYEEKTGNKYEEETV